MNSPKDEEESTEPIAQQVWNVLDSIERLGDFCCGGRIAQPLVPVLPGIYVHKLHQFDETLSLPLKPDHAKALAAVCSQAPFGRGEQTLYDTSVRNTWQLSPNEFSIRNFEWSSLITSLLPKIKLEIGLPKEVQVSAMLYKLLLYEEGGFFKPHRDTEKDDGMFATLVVMLPSEFKGGQLHVKHNKKEKTFDFASESAFNFHFLAFYADCEHEVKPVTKGTRLCLVYNLVNEANVRIGQQQHQKGDKGKDKPTPKQQPLVPMDNNDDEIEELVDILEAWRCAPAKEPVPEKLVVVLDHQYSEAGLSFVGLKNKDRVMAQAIKQAIALADERCMKKKEEAREKRRKEAAAKRRLLAKEAVKIKKKKKEEEIEEEEEEAESSKGSKRTKSGGKDKGKEPKRARRGKKAGEEEEEQEEEEEEGESNNEEEDDDDEEEEEEDEDEDEESSDDEEDENDIEEGYCLFLAILKITEHGFGETYGYNDIGMGDVTSRDLVLYNWVDEEGRPMHNMKKKGVVFIDNEDASENELLPPELLDVIDWDDQKVTVDTGNAGAFVDRWYHQAAIVFWPKSKQ